MTTLAWILVALAAIPYSLVAHLGWLFWRLSRRAGAAGDERTLHGARMGLLMCAYFLVTMALLGAQAAFREARAPLPAEAPR